MDEMLDRLKKLSAGEMTRDEVIRFAPPGCRLEEKQEKKTTFEAGVGAVHWVRDCGRLTGCTDPSDNTDWSCGDWRKTGDY